MNQCYILYCMYRDFAEMMFHHRNLVNRKSTPELELLKDRISNLELQLSARDIIDTRNKFLNYKIDTSVLNQIKSLFGLKIHESSLPSAFEWVKSLIDTNVFVPKNTFRN